MALDLTKPLMIEGVGPVRLLTSEGRLEGYPLVVEDEKGRIFRFCLDGSDPVSPLINAPESPLVRWLLVDGARYAFYTNETEARNRLSFNFGARLLRIEIPTEGNPKIEEVK